MAKGTSDPRANAQYQGAGRNLQRDMVAKWYEDLAQAEERGEPVAYLFIPGGIRELLMSFGFHCVYPEINAVQAGAKKVSLQNIMRAEDFGFQLDSNRPLESLAEFCLYHQFATLNLPSRYDLLERYFDEYQADAFVFHAVKSCRLYSMGMGDTREFFIRRRNIPTLLVESDLVDPRYFAEAQLRNRIDAFFEALEQRKYYRGETVGTQSE